MAGFALIVLGYCYFIADVKGYRKWVQPFLVYGLNSITVFVLSGIIARLTIIAKLTLDDGTRVSLKHYIYENFFASWLGPMYGSLAYAIAHIFLLYLLMLVLYKKKIFIKI